MEYNQYVPKRGDCIYYKRCISYKRYEELIFICAEDFTKESIEREINFSPNNPNFTIATTVSLYIPYKEDEELCLEDTWTIYTGTSSTLSLATEEQVDTLNDFLLTKDLKYNSELHLLQSTMPIGTLVICWYDNNKSAATIGMLTDVGDYNDSDARFIVDECEYSWAIPLKSLEQFLDFRGYPKDKREHLKL